MKKSKQKSLNPIILIIIGGVLLVGEILVIALRPKESQESSQINSTAVINSSEIARVQPEAAKAAFDAGEALFVDVRDTNAFKVSHIPGAISIPLAELQGRMDELDPNRWIIPY